MNLGSNFRPSPQAAPSRLVTPLALFEILARENADSLTAFLRAAVGDVATADDLFQDTMLIAWRRIDAYDATRPFGAWLRGIAKRLVIGHFRRVGREVATADERIIDYLDQRMSQVDSRPGDDLNEKIAALRECIEQLAAHYREPLNMHYRLKRTTEWIAENVAITRDAVQKRLQRARALLAACLVRKGTFPALDGLR